MDTQDLLSQANLAFRNGRYEEALLSYERAFRRVPDILKPSLEFNIQLARQRLNTRHGDSAPEVIRHIEFRLRLDDEIDAIAAHFDRDFYLTRYPDIAQAGVEPIEHYCGTGWKEGRDPHPDFSSSGYLALHGDIAQSGVNPYWHFVTTGKTEGRQIAPADASKQSEEQAEEPAEAISPDEQPTSSDHFEEWRAVADAISGHFDATFYRAKYPDIEQAGVDPLQHYCTAGWHERRDPSPDFSTSYYLDANSDIASAGINPFWHYVVAGKSEGRAVRHPGGYKAEVLKNLPSLEKMASQWKKGGLPPDALSTGQLIHLFETETPAEFNRLVISVGHDHYRKISGGIQLCIQREEQIAEKYHIKYLNIHPWQPLPKLATPAQDPDPLVCLLLSGKDVGVCRTSTLVQALKSLNEKFTGGMYVIIHSLLGHSIERIKDLVDLCKEKRCYLWLHDFFTLCPSFTLQRNSISFCGAPSVDSNACVICVYENERRSHQERMGRFFADTAVTVISPSEVTRQFWCSKSGQSPENVIVVPHFTMHWTPRDIPGTVDMQSPITIAFVGAPVHHKGWNAFSALVNALSKDSGYRFLYFGNHKPPLAGVEAVNVHVTTEDSFAMARAIAEAQVDYVLHWATWPETFSFTAHEAIAGGAYVLTNPISGNVAAAVERLGKGAVLASEQALIDFFQQGSARKLLETIRKDRAAQHCQPDFSEMTLPLIMNGRREA